MLFLIVRLTKLTSKQSLLGNLIKLKFNLKTLKTVQMEDIWKTLLMIDALISLEVWNAQDKIINSVS
jgi:hypothetical protein